MRGKIAVQPQMFSYVDTESRIPASHPLRAIRTLVHEVYTSLDAEFERLYSREGRPSIPPEQLLSALLLQVFFGLRSERLLMEQMEYNLLYRWFVRLGPDEKVWATTVFTKNRDRLLHGGVGRQFMAALLNHPKVKPLLSDEHFSVDGTMIEAWASQKSFQAKDGSGDGDGTDFRGKKRGNETHASVTDEDARLYKKAEGQAAKLSYLGHALMENRNGLAVDGEVTHATGTAEREAAQRLMASRVKKGKRLTMGADKGYDTKAHVDALRMLGVTPHVSQNNKNRRSAIDGRTTRHIGYGMSQSIRPRIECIFGYGKQAGTLRKTKHRGLAAVSCDFFFNLIGYNLVRIPKIWAIAG